MQLLHDLLPVIAFFVAYKAAGMYVATGVLIVAVLAQTALKYARTREVSRVSLISAGAVLVLGGITLALQDARFIQWKPTLVNWLLGAAFLGSLLVGERPLVERLIGEQVSLERPMWTRLNLAWAAFFVALGGLNLVVAYRFDEATWVNFKLFGLLGLTLAFMVVQGLWISRHALEPEGDGAGKGEGESGGESQVRPVVAAEAKPTET